jgi:hypothetical protein
MATRTSTDEVQAILGDHYDPSKSLTTFIATATALVDWLVTRDTGSELGATILERIECFLAAHFYAHADQITQSKSTGGASGSFQGQTAMVLESTLYGQTAMLLDTTSNLARRSKEVQEGGRRRVQAIWLGKAESSKLGYDERN